jgi:hypothetical protein
MKKIVLCLWAAMLFAATGFSQNTYTISGKVSGLPNVKDVPVYYTVNGNTQQQTGVLTDNSGAYRIVLPTTSSPVEVYVPAILSGCLLKSVEIIQIKDGLIWLVWATETNSGRIVQRWE